MDTATWTLTALGFAVSLTALVFSVLQYVNGRGHPKRLVVKQSLLFSLGLSVAVYLVGLAAFVVPNPSPSKGQVDIDVTPRPRLAATRDSSAEAAGKEETLDVTVDSRTIEDGSRVDPQLLLTYDYERSDGALSVTPRMPYLSLLSRGGPVQGLNEAFRWQYPELSIKVVNNTPSTLLLTELVVHVTSSAIDVEPVITFGFNTKDDLHIANQGWGAVIRPRLDLGLAPSEDCDAINPATKARHISIALERFEYGISVPLREHIAAFSRHRREADRHRQSDVDRQIAEVLILAGERVCVFGSLRYETMSDRHRTLYFKTIVYTGMTLYESVLNAPSAVYGVILPAGESGYTKRLAMAHSVESGDTDHFVLRLLPDKSARFEFTLDVLAANRDVLYRCRVFIDTFVPSGSHALRPEEQAQVGP